jgi:HEAT repeat protein
VSLSKSKISKLVADLSSGVESEAKRAALMLDGLLYPNYGPGPRIVSAAESQQITDAHYGSIRGTTALDPLLEAARRGTIFARAYAVSTLGCIGDRRALPVVIDALSDASPMVRRSATTSLMHFQEPSTVPLLIRALEDSASEVCRSAASVLGCFHSADAVIPLMAYYERGDREAKVAALCALGHIGDPRSLPLARAALLDKVRKVRDAAKSALANYDFKRRHEC